jgi:hypothetical protein
VNPLEQVNRYLHSLERRLRWGAFTKGAAITAVAALVITILLVLYTNAYAFSELSLRIARVLLVISLALAIGFGLLLPLLSLNRRRAARRAESAMPEFNERLLTFAEKNQQSDPFLELLAADTMEVAQSAHPDRIISPAWMFGSASAAAFAALGLIWLILSAPGFMGHGASLLWAGAPREGMRAGFYDIVVAPGNKSVRKKSDQSVTAQMVGFDSRNATLFAKFAGTSKWEPAPMAPQPSGAVFEFLFAGLPDSVEYYVESNGVRSKTYNLTALDLPGIKKLRVTYNYPKWAGLKPAVEEPGGDLRAIEGTEATVAIETDKPLKSAVIILDNGERIEMQKGEANWLAASLPIKADGMYHIATVDKSEDIRLSDDYFIEAQKEQPPKVKIARPARDFKVNPIEEVTVQVEAEDDFALQDVLLSYSVNGGPEKSVSVLKHKGAKTAEGETMLSLEDFKLVPGDVVALHARARDARSETMTDIMFLEAQPFEREYQQSQQMGGGGGGGEQEDDNVSKRQKEIIAATFNQIRDKGKNKSAENENAKFLADTQGKLRDQSRSLANRMKSRELAQQNAEFQSFAKDMEQAAQAMNEAVDKLKLKGWKDAIQPEQKALQYLLRAEATRRQIQVAYGRQNGGGGGGGAGRDLESLFDLELDTEKNQYETGMQSASGDRKQKEADEALQKLEQLARRQQELAQQQRDQRQSPQQRWQQEMLRREAEELKKKMEELARNQTGQGQGAQSNQLRQAIDRLQRATDDMRQAASSQAAQPQAGSAEARRAADRLQEARDSVRGMRNQESGQQMSDLTRRADKLAQDQREFVDKLKQTYGDGAQTRPMPGQDGGKAEQLAKQKEQMLNDLNGLERDMQNAARNMAGTQRGASSKVREALGEMQQNELKLRMKYSAEWIRRGLGGYVGSRETPVTMGLESLRNQLHNAESAMTPSNDKGKQSGVEQALNQIERTRQQLQRASSGQQQGQQGQRGQKGQQQGQQGQGQQGQQGQKGQEGQQGQQGQGQEGRGQQGQGQQAGQQQGQGQQGQQQGQDGQQGQGGQQGQNGQQAGGGNGGQGGRRGDQFGGGEMGVYRSGDSISQQGPISQAAAEQAFRNSVRDLQQLRQGLQDNPELAKEVENTLREIQRWDPAKHPGNPALLELMRTQVLPNIEQLELQLRRKLEGKDGEVRSSAAERIPQGYGDAVAEYFRRLSKAK